MEKEIPLLIRRGTQKTLEAHTTYKVQEIPKVGRFRRSLPKDIEIENSCWGAETLRWTCLRVGREGPGMQLSRSVTHAAVGSAAVTHTPVSNPDKLLMHQVDLGRSFVWSVISLLSVMIRHVFMSF